MKEERRKHFIQTFNINEEQAGFRDRDSPKKIKNFFLSSAAKFSTRRHVQSKFTYVLQHTLNQELVKFCLHRNLQDVAI